MLIELNHAFSGEGQIIYIVAAHIVALQEGEETYYTPSVKYTKVITTYGTFALKESIPEITEKMEKALNADTHE